MQAMETEISRRGQMALRHEFVQARATLRSLDRQIQWEKYSLRRDREVIFQRDWDDDRDVDLLNTSYQEALISHQERMNFLHEQKDECYALLQGQWEP